MRLQTFTNFLLKHRWLTLAMTFIATLLGTHINLLKQSAPISLLFVSFLLGLLFCTASIVTAAFVTLIEGYFWGGIFTIAATIPYVTFLLEAKQDFLLLVWISVGIAVLGNLGTWIFAFMLRNRMSWTQIIHVGALFTVLAISVLHLVFPEINNWWTDQLHLLQNSIATSNTKAASLNKADIATGAQFVNGMIASFVLISAISQLMFARWWQFKVMKHNLSLHRELYDIRLAPLAGTLFFCSLIFSYFGNTVVLDIMPVLYVLFGIAGLSLVHFLLQNVRSSRTFWFVVMYIAFFFLQPISIMLVSLIALFDTWLDVRKRLKKV